MVDGQLSFFEAALKGYTTWKTGHGSTPQDDVRLQIRGAGLEADSAVKEQLRTTIEDHLERWGDRLLQMEFEVAALGLKVYSRR